MIEKLKLVTSMTRGKELLADALGDETGSSWPEAHFLGPLHPVLDWAADRALATLGRNQVFVVRGAVDVPTVLLAGHPDQPPWPGRGVGAPPPVSPIRLTQDSAWSPRTSRRLR